MITNFKIFEIKSNEDDLEIGDFVLIEGGSFFIEDFISSNIGRIESFYINDKGREMIVVKYNNIPTDIYGFFDNNKRHFGVNQVLYASKNKKDLEIMIDSDKYNL